MNFIFKKKTPIAQYISITALGPKHTQKLNKQLETLKKGQNIKAILAGINVRSQANQLVQAEKVGVLLQEKAKELDVPLITYAEEQAFGVGLYLLTCGSKIICNPSTMIGNVGFTIGPSQLKYFTQEWKVQAKFITRGKNKARLNRFEDFKPEDIEWIL